MPELNIPKLNSDLPSDIRIFGLKRVTKTFHARTTAERRTYSYTLPTAALAHHTEAVTLLNYRVDSDRVQMVYDLLQLYKGSKNFHNFTIQKEYFENSSYRLMLRLDVSQPFIRQGMEMVTIRIDGASFMMHQIRKMIGLILAVVRGATDDSIFQRVFDANIIDLPTAPGLGLALEQVHYDKYNRLFGNVHSPLTWDEYEEDINDFREKFIMPTMVRGELELNSMLGWTDSLHRHSYQAVPKELLNTVRGDRPARESFNDDVTSSSDNEKNASELIKSCRYT